jgi:hypothetical protein
LIPGESSAPSWEGECDDEREPKNRANAGKTLHGFVSPCENLIPGLRSVWQHILGYAFFVIFEVEFRPASI